MRLSVKLLALSSTVLLALPAQAALVVVDHDFNPANVQDAFTLGFAQENLAAPITLAEGDTLDFTVTFGGAFTLQNDNTYLWPLLFTDDSDVLQVSGTFEFLGASANLISGPFAVSQSNSFVHIGVFLSESQYRLAPGELTFFGIRQILTIDNSVNDLVREYDTIAVSANGLVPVIPEPATWAMMLIGFGAAGTALRRRSRATISFG